MEVVNPSLIKILTNLELNKANLIVYKNEMHNFENLFFKNDLLFTNLFFEDDEDDEDDKKIGGDGGIQEPENIYTFMCYIYDRIHDFINGSRTNTIGEFISFTQNEIVLFEQYGSLLQENDNAYNIFNSIRMLLDDYKKTLPKGSDEPPEYINPEVVEEEPPAKKSNSMEAVAYESPITEAPDESKMEIEGAYADGPANAIPLDQEILEFKDRFVKLASTMIKNQIPKLQNYNNKQKGLNESNLVLDILDTKFYSFDCINSCKQEFILRYNESDATKEEIKTEQTTIKQNINTLITTLKVENIIYIKEEDKKDSTNNVLKRYVVYIFPKNKYIPEEFFSQDKNSYYVTDVNIRASQQYYLYVKINETFEYEKLKNYDEYLEFCRNIDSKIENLKQTQDLVTPLNGLDPVNGSAIKETFFVRYNVNNSHLKNNVDNVMINALTELQILIKNSYNINTEMQIPEITNIEITNIDKSITIQLTINAKEHNYEFVQNFSTVDKVSLLVFQLNSDTIDETFNEEIKFIEFLLDTSLNQTDIVTKRDIIISMLYFFKYMGDRNPRKFSDDIYPNTTFITNDRPNISFKLLNYIIELIQKPIKINDFTGIISSINTNLVLDADPIAVSSADSQLSLPTKSSTEYLTVIYIGSTTETNHKKRYVENVKTRIKEMFFDSGSILIEHLINEETVESNNFEFLNFVNFYKTYKNTLFEPNNTSLIKQEINNYLGSKSKISYSSLFKPVNLLETGDDKIYIGHLYTLYKTFLSLDISFVKKIDERFDQFVSTVLNILLELYNETLTKIGTIQLPIQNQRASRHKDSKKTYVDDEGKQEANEEKKLDNMLNALNDEKKKLYNIEVKIEKDKTQQNTKKRKRTITEDITENIKKKITSLTKKKNDVIEKIKHHANNIFKQRNKLEAIKNGIENESKKKDFKFPNAMEVKQFLRTRIDDLTKSFAFPKAPSDTPPTQAPSETPDTDTLPPPPPPRGGKHKKSRKNRKRRTMLNNKKTKRKTKHKSRKTKKQHIKNKKHKRTRNNKQYKH
jgi:hypothetical protein